MAGETPEERGGVVRPLSHRQTMIWAGQVLDPDVPLYNMAHAFTIDLALDVAAFQTAFDALVAGADALRTVIIDQDGHPAQQVLPTMDSRLEMVDLSAGGGTEDDAGGATEKEVRSWVAERATRRFDLAEQLFDAALVKLADDRYVWFLNQHHLICDAWAVSLLLQRQGDLYHLALDGRVDEAEPLPAYLDFLDTEADQVGSKAHQKSIDFWAEKLSVERIGPAEPQAFFGPRPDEVGPETVRVAAAIDGERAERLQAFLADPGFAALSPELTALRFFHTVLFAYLDRLNATGAADHPRLVVGTPFHNRAKRAAKQTVGLFMNLYPVTASVEPGQTMAELADALGAEVFENLQHARFPIGQAEEARAFEVVLNYLHIPHETFGEVPVDDLWVHPGAGDRGHSLRWQIRRADDGYKLFFDVKTELFDEPARAALVDHILGIIDQWLAAPTIDVGALRLLSDTDRQRLLEDYNTPSGPPVPTESVIARFETQAAATPNAIAVEGPAVEGPAGTLTYAELDRRANRVANHLIATGLQPGDYVGILLPRSPDVVAAILGVLKAGGAYLPMEPSIPAGRLAQIVKDTGARLICTDQAGRAGAEQAGTAPVLFDGTDSPLAGGGDISDTAPDRAIPLDSTAYAIFTSGSTGKPKGVPVTHEGLANYISWAVRQYTEGEARRFALFTSLAFDLTITSIFVPLTSGGSIVAYPDDETDGVPTVVTVWEENRVDIIKATPSHLAIIRQLGLSADNIKVAVIGGEDLTSDLARAIQDQHPQLAMYNEYGPTEAVVGCMIHRFDAATDRWPSVPIGVPAANAQIYLLDRYGMPVPPGVVGEMYIGGPGVTQGYLGRPDLTAERFVDRPTGLVAITEPRADGADQGRLYRTGDLGRWRLVDGPPQLEFLGRADDQVKIRGHRIELGEIESALVALPGVDHTAVTVVTERVAAAGSTSGFGAAVPVALPVDKVEHCVRCGLPSNYPDATFTDGVCSICLDFDTYRDKVEDYFRDLDELAHVADTIKADRGDSPYDCLVLLSGGKDSTYMLYQVVALGLKPLVFTLDNGYISEVALANCRRVCDHLDVELVIGSTEHMNEIFRDSLDRFANVCNGCFKTIYTLSMNLAKQHGLGYIVTGLARGQLFETRLSDMYNHRIFDVDQIDQYVLEARKAYHLIEDSVSELLDVSAFEGGKIYDEITFVDYYRYADVPLDVVLGFLNDQTPWERPPDTGRSTNCLINDVGIHIHNHERGYHNYALPYSWDVRLGHKERDAALDELDDDIDQDFVNEVLVEIGYKPKPPPQERETARIVAHYQGPGERAADELRAGLADVLPEYMVPTSFVHHDQLPLTRNGKIDRAALAQHKADRRPTVDRSTMTDDAVRAAEVLAGIWATIFNRDIDFDHNFFELGGDSITAIQIVDRAASAGVTLSPRLMFESDTLAATAIAATAIAATSDSTADAAPVDRGAALEPVEPVELVAPVGFDQPQPLTPTQSGMLFHSLAAPGSGVYEGQIVHHMDGPIDTTVLDRCWQALVERHDAFRLRFQWEGDDQPTQVVADGAPTPLVIEDWSAVDGGEAEAERRLEVFLDQDRALGFDLRTGPPVRVAVLALPTESVMVWSFHHIALDGWSIALAMNELLDSYQAEVDGRSWQPPARAPFAQYLSWLDQQDQSGAERFWTDYLDGFDSPTALPRTVTSGTETGPEGGQPVPYAATIRNLPGSVADAIAGFGRQERVTMSTVLQAAWGLVLGRHENSDDVVFGVTTSGRPASLPDAERMVGMLVTTLPTRIGLPAATPTGAWLRRIQTDQLSIREREYASLVDVQRWSSVPSGQSLFDSILVVENFPDYQPPTDGDGGVAGSAALAIGSRDYRVQSNYPLSIIVLPGDQLTVKAVYNPTQFSPERIDQLLDHLEAAIAALVAPTSETAETVGDLTIVSPAETARLGALEQGVSLELPAKTQPDLLPDRIRQLGAEQPDAVAAVCGDDQITYGQLAARASAVAGGLTAAGAGPNTPVGILADRSVAMVVAIAAVMEAGAAYVPLDPNYPSQRLQFMMADAGIDLVVATEAADRTVLPDDLGAPTAPATTIADTGLMVLGSAGADTGQPRPVTADDLAYIIYTSGSTGQPNGVPITHGNLAFSTAARFTAYRHQPSSFLLLSSFSFDSSIVGIFWTLAAGGSLVLPQPGEELDVRVLSRLIADHRVSHTLALPSLYRLVLDYADTSSLTSLETVVVAGEACPADLVEAHLSTLPDTELHNEYGPTEASVWCTVHHCTEADTGSVPIGGPIPGATVRVVDVAGRPSGFGVQGEIVIAGPGLASGYLNRPELTAERFVEFDGQRWFRTRDQGSVRADGAIEFGGRVDGQVKIRGHRVELGEVEAVVAAHPSVEQAVVVANDGGRTGTTLVAFVEPAAGSTTPPGDLPATVQAAVADRLPDPFVPARVLVLDRLPRLPNGKVDRGQLPEVTPDADGCDGRPPSTPTEQTIFDIWQELLPDIAFGVDDDFFDVGGHSLVAVSLVERIRRATGTDLPLSALLKAPTIAGLARMTEPGGDAPVDGDGQARTWRSLVPLRETGSRVPLYLIPPAAGTALSFRSFVADADPDQPLYCFEPLGSDGSSEPHDTVEAMAALYIEELTAAQPDGRYRIGGSCLGAIVAWEMACQLAAAGSPVELLVFLDPGPPHSGPTWSYNLPTRRSPTELIRSVVDTVTAGEVVSAAQAVWRRNRFDRIGRIHYRAQLSYVADRLAGVPIIWLESQELSEDRPDFLTQWRVLAGNDLTPIIVPDTTHDGLMTSQPDQVARMAELFNNAMRSFGQ